MASLRPDCADWIDLLSMTPDLLRSAVPALSSLIFLGILIPQLTVVNERKQDNLAFAMSLPISPAEYTMSKVLGNLSAFVVRRAGAVRLVLPAARRGDRHRV